MGTVDNRERGFQNGGKRKGVVDATVLDVAVDGSESAGDRMRRSHPVSAVSSGCCESRRHFFCEREKRFVTMTSFESGQCKFKCLPKFHLKNK